MHFLRGPFCSIVIAACTWCSNMKNLISVALILLLIAVINAREEYQFGDIVAFPRIKVCGCKTPLYKHYAIYVGNVSIEGKAPDQDIFHRTGPSKSEADCIFGKLSNEPKHNRDNYLDGRFPVGDRETILGRIVEKKNKCEDYSLRKNNCEHLATFVRYGKKRAEQHDTFAKAGTFWCTNEKRRKRDTAPDLILVPDYESVSCEELCTGSASSKSGYNLIGLSLLIFTHVTSCLM